MSFGVGVTLHETRHFLAEFSFVDVIKVENERKHYCRIIQTASTKSNYQATKDDEVKKKRYRTKNESN